MASSPEAAAGLPSEAIRNPYGRIGDTSGVHAHTGGGGAIGLRKLRVPDLHIAVVDDDEGVRLSTRDLLRSFGARVAAFESAEHFLAAAADLAKIDLLITDFKMPGTNATGLIEALRARGATFPVVVMSGVDSDSTRTAVMEKGAAAFLPKPVDPDELARLLEALQS